MLVLDMVFIVLRYQASLLRRNNIFFDIFFTHCTHRTHNDDFFFQRVIFQKGLGILGDFRTFSKLYFPRNRRIWYLVLYVFYGYYIFVP